MANNDKQLELSAKSNSVRYRSVTFFMTFLLSAAVAFGQINQQVDDSNFDKQKWLTSSVYRYEIVKGASFPALENLTKKQIIRILGEPDFKERKVLIYCFHLSKDNVKKNRCEGSFLTIDLDKKTPPKFRVTIVWVNK
jgi:hypothetical protein